MVFLAIKRMQGILNYDIVQFNKGAKRTDLGVTRMTLTFNNQSTNNIISVS